MGPPVDFDLAVLILRVLEGWELGNDGVYGKYWPYVKKLKKIQNLKIFILVPGVQKNDFPDFSRFFTKRSGKSKIVIFTEIAISGNRNLSAL